MPPGLLVQSPELSCVLRRFSNTWSPPVKSCHMSTISDFLNIREFLKRNPLNISSIFPQFLKRNPPTYSLLFREDSEIKATCLQLISSSINQEDVSKCAATLCNINWLHYQFPQRKLDGMLSAFSLLIISREMGAWYWYW